MRTTGGRGVYTVWWVFVMFALFVAWGLIVDGGGKIHAKQHANFVAEEAARTAGQQVIRPLGMRGIAAVSDPITSQVAAQLYMAQYPEVKGVVITIGPTTVTAVVSTVYEPKFLNMLGAGPQPVEGRAVITLNRTNTGGLP